MPKNIDVITDRNQLQTIPAPINSGILEHKVIADLVINMLSNKGITVIKEEYRTNINNDIIQGVLHLEQVLDDPTNGLMITWINSYEKTTGFRCEMGSFNKSDGINLFIARDSKAFRRNSTDLVIHTTEYLEERINEGLNNFGDFLIIRDKLKDTTISKDTYEKMIGSFYFKDAITSSQLITLKSNHKIEQAHNVWEAWLLIAKTFKSCHPKVWFKQQSILSESLIESYIAAPVLVDPAQTDLITMIDEVSTESDFEFEITTEIESVTDEVTEESESPVLSLGDYDLAVKKEPLVEEGNNLIEEPEIIMEPEPVNVSPEFSLEDYDPSGFPLPPEDLPVEITESDIDYTDMEYYHNVANIEQVVKETEIEDLLSMEKEPEEIPPTMEETYELIEEQQAEEFAEEPKHGIEGVEGGHQFIPSIQNGSNEEEFIEYPEMNDTEAQNELEAQKEFSITDAIQDLNNSMNGNDWDIDKAEKAIPLEEQVASSEPQPVSEDEITISKEPIVNEPSLNNDSNDEATLESPNFEF